MSNEKNKTELWRIYLNGELETLNVDELKELQELIKTHGAIKKETKVEIVEKIVEPEDKMNLDNSERKGEGDRNLHGWFNNYTKDFEVPKENSKIYNAYFTNADSDSGCEDIITAWSPEDSYAKAIWYGVLCEVDLFQVCVNNIDIHKGQGLTMQIRVAGNFGDPVEKASCECSSCASIAYTTHSLTLKQYNLESITCEKDIWDAGEVVMEATVESMKRSWVRWFNAQIYSKLETASPGQTEILASALACDPSMSGSCCSDSAFYNLYNSIESAVAVQRAAGYNPDYLIVSPSVAKVLKNIQQGAVPLWASREFTFGADGKMTHGAGLRVIEYCSANTCSNATGEVMAIVLDSSRTIGSAFGLRPKMYKFFQSNCNSYRIDFWSFWACGTLDLGGLTHIVNP